MDNSKLFGEGEKLMNIIERENLFELLIEKLKI